MKTTKKPLGKAASRTSEARRALADRRGLRRFANTLDVEARDLKRAADLIRRRLAS